MLSLSRTHDISTFFLAASLVTLSACGAHKTTKKKTAPTKEENAQTVEGHYRVRLAPLNEHIVASVQGTGEFKIAGDEVKMQIDLSGSHPYVEHIQNIRIGKKCPEMRHDTNRDGIIDIQEARSVSGDVMVPLDADLDFQDSGEETYPISNSEGVYRWFDTTSYIKMMDDLHAEDLNDQDGIVKLPDDKELILEGRVVIIHGVSETVTLPETVSSFRGLTPQLTLPIACGRIERVQE